MRHGSGNRRQRNRNNGRRNNNGNGGAPNRSQVFDSNGPEVRIRGTAHQIVEKYAALAKDATSSGDMTLAENYLQHAEHYQRIIVGWDEMDRERAERQAQQKAKEEAKQAKAEQEEDDLALPSSVIPEAPVVSEESKPVPEDA
ncbi:MAG: hypothetical protein CL570_01425 [Alphaproteobacteria bacterium]|nr:hypothetical protein [Alphaproteobacteria bacterium]|tara:strand:+ start:108181 stop:108609 length:429 start_codon:yes stop_codon:yes gene_type:complete